jgi:next-to-BRCA1 protein 1
VGGEIDVCVDFVAPVKPGRYISYWRLTSPDLVKFGQRVWVLIQVFTWPLLRSCPSLPWYFSYSCLGVQVEQPVQTSGKNGTAEIDLNLPADGNPTTSKPFMV